MSRSVERRASPSLAVTLVSGSDFGTASYVSRVLSGRTGVGAPDELDLPGGDSAELGAHLAEQLADNARSGRRGRAVVTLDPSADVLELGLVMEHVLHQADGAAPVGIHHIVAVTSVREIHNVLVGSTPATANDRVAPGDFDAPGQLAQRIEFSTAVVLTDGESAQAGEAAVAQDIISALAPLSRVLYPSGVDRLGRETAVVTRGRAHGVGSSMGWQQDIAGEGPSRSPGGAVSTFVFRDPRPFHPGRLYRAVTTDLVPGRAGHVLRSRGFAKLASRPGLVGFWATAGDVFELNPTDMASWDADSPIGQEIVFYGLGIDPPVLEAALGRCLLTEEEILGGPPAWNRFADPFPAWPPHHSHELE